MKYMISIIFSFSLLLSFLSSIALTDSKDNSGFADSEIYLGFIDTYSEHSKGSIFLEVNYKSVDASKECEILTEKLYQQHKKSLFPVKYESIKNYINSGQNDSFDVYTSKGYLGTYPISSYMLLTNECGGGVYPYIKLDTKLGIKTNDNQDHVIAHKKSSNKYTVLNNIDVKFANNNIKNILVKKNKLAIERLKKINSDASRDLNKFTKKANYSIYEIDKNEYFVHCTWRFKSEEDEIGCCITNTFIVMNDKIYEVENFKVSDGDSIDVPNYKLAIRDKNLIYFVVEHEHYEGLSAEIIKLDNSNLIEVHTGNYFGC